MSKFISPSNLCAGLGAQQPFQEFLADVSSLGVSPSRTGTGYAILGARSNQRWWLVPLGRGGACVRSGLEMYQPVSYAGRLAKMGLQLAARTMPAAFWVTKRINLSGQPSFPGLFNRPDLCLAYFTGTDGPHRKTTVQIMEGDGAILGYAKLSRQANVRKYVENEARMLGLISELNLQTAEVPSLLELRNEEFFSCLVTNTRRSAGCPTLLNLEIRHVAFLRELAEKTGGTGADHPISELRQFCAEADDWLPDDWKRRFDVGLSMLTGVAGHMPVCLAHGDFTPWNCFALGDRLYVFDWEYAQKVAPLGSDMVHFLLATRYGQPPLSLVAHLRKTLAQTLYGGDLVGAEKAILLTLMMHAAFYFNRLRVINIDADAWQEATFRASVIDFLLAEMSMPGAAQ